MTTAQVVETSVTVNNDSPIKDYVHLNSTYFWNDSWVQTFHTQILPNLLAAVFLGTRDCSSKIVHGTIFLKWNPRERFRNILGWGFYGINMVKTGQSWCSAVIYRKPNAFEMQFHLNLVSILLWKIMEKALADY